MSTIEKYNYYLVPGLGFNKRTFENLSLPFAASVNIIEWLEPEEEEDLNIYISRMAESINLSHKHKIFIGHSFGGVVVQEFSQFIHCEKVFLISSIKSPDEKSWNLNILKKVPAYKLVNHGMINKTIDMWAKMHDFLNEDEKNVFLDMVNKMSMDYFKWAVDAILNWEGIKDRKLDPIQLHGTNDKTFPFNQIDNPIPLKDAGHFMVYNRANEISEIIKREIEATDVPLFNT